MMMRVVTTTACLAAALLAGSAGAGSPADDEAGRSTATEACADVNGYGPVRQTRAAADGLGDWLVWVEDRDGDLWLCNAAADGAVYANAVIQGDLLKGHGAKLLEARPAPRLVESDAEPQAKAEQLCEAVGDVIGDMDVAAAVEDAMGDYLVWLRDADEALWMCNASADQKLYAFEAVRLPINGGEEGAEPGPSEDLQVSGGPRGPVI